MPPTFPPPPPPPDGREDNEVIILTREQDLSNERARIIAIVSVAAFALLLAGIIILFKVYGRRHRVKCARKMESLLIDIAKIQGMILFDSGNSDDVIVHSNSKTAPSNRSARKLRSPSRTLRDLKTINRDYFPNWTDGVTIAERSSRSEVYPIRVLVCVQDDVSTETCKVAVVEALRKLCAHHHLDIRSLCFCIVGNIRPDADIPGVLRPIGETPVLQRHGLEFAENEIDFTESVSNPISPKLGGMLNGGSSGNLSEESCPVEIFPNLCDVADYCLLLREPPREDTNPNPVTSDTPTYTATWTRKTTVDNYVNAVMDQKLIGASSFVIGLSVVALKSDDEAFIVTRGSNYELESFESYAPELCNGWRFFHELQGVKLSGALLRLWALAVSHGSAEFVTRAKPWLDQVPRYMKFGVCAPLCCCATRAAKRSVQASYINIILQIFLSLRRDDPIIPLAAEDEITKTKLTSHQLDRLCSGDPKTIGNETKLIRKWIGRRRTICRAARLRCIARESHFDFSMSSKDLVFRPPFKEPCASLLAATGEAFDECFEHASEKLFPHLSRHITLDSLAARIRAFYISFLRRLNGDPGNCDSELACGATARHAICKAYTTAAEASGHVVDHVRKYLCEIAEPQSYKHLLTAIQSINSSTNIETSSRMAHHVEVDIIAAFDLRNAETAACLFYNLSDPYCTVELSGKPWTKLRTEVIGETLNPVWNFHGVLEDYDFGDGLFFQVWDDDTTSFDDSLGTAILSGDHFERGVFEGTLSLSEVKGHYGAKLKVRVRVFKSDKPAPILPRPDSMDVVLQRAQIVHKKLQRTIRHVVREATEECVARDIAGARRIIHSGRKTSFWHFIQRSTTVDVEKQMRQVSLATGLMERQSRSSIETVDGLLKSMVTGSFDLASIPEDFPYARHHITCDSFIIMRYVLQVMRESNAIEIHSVKETWRDVMMLPQIWIRASLNDCKVEGNPHMVMIVIQHSKITALVESTENWSWAVDILHEVPPLCRTLKMQDPHIHPSRWCLSFGQLKELAQKAHKELGDEIYAEATMTDIVKKYIWERTEEAGLSYACLTNWQKLREVDVFVSHAWKENFKRFVESVGQALSQRLEADETNLWICSLAIFQSKNKALVKEQIGADLMDAPFDKALRRAKEVLVVRNNTIDNYQRAWCVYEIFRARQLALKITITGPDTFKGGSVDILSCKASDPNDEKQIKDAITNAGLEKTLNALVTEIKNKGSFGLTFFQESPEHGIKFTKSSDSTRRVTAI